MHCPLELKRPLSSTILSTLATWTPTYQHSTHQSIPPAWPPLSPVPPPTHYRLALVPTPDLPAGRTQSTTPSGISCTVRCACVKTNAARDALSQSRLALWEVQSPFGGTRAFYYQIQGEAFAAASFVISEHSLLKGPPMLTPPNIEVKSSKCQQGLRRKGWISAVVEVSYSLSTQLLCFKTNNPAYSEVLI